MKNWLQRLQPISDQLGYQAYADMLGNIMTRGNSAKRQQRLWEASQRLETVSQFNCDEFAAQTPLWDKLESLLSDLAVIKDKEPPQKTA
jgi:gamma-glutamyl:cysteine ligase YbdK (ATP-grasp superfamily)